MAENKTDIQSKKDVNEMSPQVLNLVTVSPEPSSTKETTENEGFIVEAYPTGPRLTAIVVSLMLGMFLVALDNVSHIFKNKQ
jgi:hypothetical protein